MAPALPDRLHSCRRIDGNWQQIHDMLSAWVRQKTGRHKHPTAGSIDSQSDKTTALVGIIGFDTGKNFKAASHILVDSLDLILVVIVTAASVQDRDSAKQFFQSFTQVSANPFVLNFEPGC